jgi:CBS domain-containing protein
MQAISEVMTRDVTVVRPDANLQEAACMMRDWDIGSVPVCDGKRLVGMITDRDITIRSVAEGKSPTDMKVSDVMSDQVLWCFEDQTVGEVLQQMGDQQIRRIPVVSRNMDLTGIVSLGDLATRHPADTDNALEEISTPSEPNRQSADEMRTRH